MTNAAGLPQWDMTVIYPSLESREFGEAFQAFARHLGEVSELFDQHGIAGQATRLSITSATVRAFEEVLNRYNALLDELITLRAYVSSFVSTNSRDELAQARMSELQQLLIPLAQLQTRLTAWLGSLEVEDLMERSSLARDHSFAVHRAATQAAHLMTAAEENLATELSVTGGSAWSKLHDSVTSQLMVPLEIGDEVTETPMSVVRAMAHDRDREVRRLAYEAELHAWERAAVPLAAALNSIKGETNTLAQRRHWASALEVALFNNNIDRPTLDAMLEAARASFPDFRRYLRAKAQLLGVSSLAWYDLFAPVGSEQRSWDFETATDFLLDQFGTYSPRLHDFAERAFREHWIDAAPRPGKRDGAFCMAVRPGESRILANFKDSYAGMKTLAHELGHGYHNYKLARRTPLQRATPMTLAETASIFCETIVRHAALHQVGEEEQITILEAALEGSTQVVVDITSRFLFESAVFERRRQRELAISELNDLMLDAQIQTYGDGLDQSVLHPFMWAVKGHYYSVERPFYNFPYMFGLLFGLGLYALYQQAPDEFLSSYDDLLASTGMSDAATLAGRFGIDIRTPDFWNGSLDVIRRDVDRFEHLIAGQGATV